MRTTVAEKTIPVASSYRYWYVAGPCRLLSSSNSSLFTVLAIKTCKLEFFAELPSMGVSELVFVTLYLFMKTTVG